MKRTPAGLIKKGPWVKQVWLKLIVPSLYPDCEEHVRMPVERDSWMGAIPILLLPEQQVVCKEI